MKTKNYTPRKLQRLFTHHAKYTHTEQRGENFEKHIFERNKKKKVFYIYPSAKLMRTVYFD